MADRGFQLVVKTKLDGLEERYFHFDTCTKKTITSSAQIMGQPIQSGEYISDHMYSMPDTMSISGSFSLFGNIAKDYEDLPEVKGLGIDRLTIIQTIFEYIKDNGILCDLITREETESGESIGIRFKERRSMALERVSWEEHQSHVDFTFEFKEVLTVNMQDIDVIEQYPDSDEPLMTSPTLSTLGSLLIDDTASNGTTIDPVTELVINALLENGYINEYYASYIYKYMNNEFSNTYTAAADSVMLNIQNAIISGLEKNMDINDKSLGIAIGIGVTGLGLVVGTIIASGPVGWILGGIALLTVGICATINAANEKTKRKNARDIAISRFLYGFQLIVDLDKYIQDDGTVDIDAAGKAGLTYNESEFLRLEKLLIEIKNAIKNLETDILVYQLANSKQDNNDRKFVLTIDNTPYLIECVNNRQEKNIGWEFKVTTQDNITGEWVSLSGLNGKVVSNKVCLSLEEMVPTNAFFYGKKTNINVYLYAPNIINEEEHKYLYNYLLIVAFSPIENNIQKINNKIIDTLQNYTGE